MDSVKLTKKGVSLLITRSMKADFRRMLESVIADNVGGSVRINHHYYSLNTAEKVRFLLAHDVYVRNFAALAIKAEYKMMVSRAEAISLFTFWVDYQPEIDNPELGNLFMEIHRKL